MVTYLLVATGLVLIVAFVIVSLRRRPAGQAETAAKLESAGDSFFGQPLPADRLEPWAAAETGAHTTIFDWIESASSPRSDGLSPAPTVADATEPVGLPFGGILAEGSLENVGVDSLLKIAAAFQTAGYLQLYLPGPRVVNAHFAEGCLTSLTDTGRVWRLGDLLGCLGRLSDDDREHLLTESEARGVTLGRLVLDDEYLPSAEVETLLRRLAMHSLLLAMENQSAGTFRMGLEENFRPTVMLPVSDFVRELGSAGVQLERLRGLLGRWGGSLSATQDLAPMRGGEAPDYRQVQVFAQVDGEKTPMELAASSPLPPAETLEILCDLAERGWIGWAPSVEDETTTDFEFLTVATG